MSAAKTKTAHLGRVFLSKSKNRPYLPGCPADIVNAEFYLDLKLQKKVMKLSIRNRSDRAVTGMTVLARYLDKSGAVIGDPAGHIILRFTNIFCAAHETSLGSKTVVLPYQDIAGIEAYITQLVFADGEGLRHQESMDIAQKQYTAQTNSVLIQQQMLDQQRKAADESLTSNE